jgi:hypothetical protein
VFISNLNLRMIPVSKPLRGLNNYWLLSELHFVTIR